MIHHDSPWFTIIHDYSPWFTMIHHYSPLFTMIHHYSPLLRIINHINKSPNIANVHTNPEDFDLCSLLWMWGGESFTVITAGWDDVISQLFWPYPQKFLMYTCVYIYKYVRLGVVAFFGNGHLFNLFQQKHGPKKFIRDKFGYNPP